MAGLAQPAVERLRLFLRELPPGARALLIAELERAMLRGDDFAGAELILSELRSAVRASQSNEPRIGEAARLFFEPFQPFLVDDHPDNKHRGRIARSAIEPIWLWLSDMVMPGQARTYVEQAENALKSGDEAKTQQLVRNFQGSVLERIEDLLDSAGSDDKAKRRIGVQLGTPRALDDLQTMAGVLKFRDGLATFGTQLPGHINNLNGAPLDNIKAQLDARLQSNPDFFLYALILAMTRLAAPWQLIRLAVKAAGSDNAARIEGTQYAVAVTIVLAEVARTVNELGTDLKSGRGFAVVAMLKDVHDAVRGLRTELDFAADSAWGKQLAAIRAEISKLLSGEINLMPGRVRRLMRPRPAKEIAPGATVNADEVAEAEFLVGFVMACRTYAGELAINEITQRTFSDLQQCLDAGTKSLLDALRTCGEGERPFRQSQVDAAVRFCGKVFGQEYASLLIKAADVASHGDRRSARA